MGILKELRKMVIRVPAFEMLEKEVIYGPPSNPLWAALAAACPRAAIVFPPFGLALLVAHKMLT